MTDSIEENAYSESADYIKSRLPEKYQKVKIGIICGSGLGGLVDTIDSATKIEIAYKQIPHFVQTTVEGHDGKLVFGLVGESGTPTVCMVGRCHFYEGYTMQQCTFPVRVMSLLGVECLIVTNACGGLQPEHKVQDIVVIHDHVCLPALAGNHPLRGNNINSFGPRFPDISDAYTYQLRQLAFQAAFDEDIAEDDIHEGVYCMYTGPSFESPAEARFLQAVGVDVVGMSTVPEVLVASHAGMKVLGLSLITALTIKHRGRNAKLDVLGKAKYTTTKALVTTSHEKVLEESSKRVSDLQRMIRRFIDSLNSSSSKL